jgi:hypothetical protein
MRLNYDSYADFARIRDFKEQSDEAYCVSQLKDLAFREAARVIGAVF